MRLLHLLNLCASSSGRWDDQALIGFQPTRSLEATSSCCILCSLLSCAFVVVSQGASGSYIHDIINQSPVFNLFLSCLLFLTTVMSLFYTYRPVMTPAEMIAWSKNI
ncbi:hypothetical protein BRADI_3g48875v3 [Brachypodium distachyon]|uniref:Uncharacterized protein n=1 Tax=Brachypodium distachyon TaxID=15368 RepID=A0A2K2D481_BRADI|nr:hypothetical protein BRADI_3g48875v3 [Brachypodium distachyon]